LRVRFAAVLASIVASLGVTPAAVAPVFTDVCVVSDPRAMELSGLVATSTGYVAVNDSNFDPAKIRIFFLDLNCKVTRTVGYPSAARDPEDVAIGPDGVLWVGDIGDNTNNDTRRTTIAVWRVPAGGGAPVINRLTYPDGPHDAEALLINGDGRPVIVTKELSGVSGLYTTTGNLQPNTASGVPLTKVGEFRPVITGVVNPFGSVGEQLVTGAATAPDRHRVALRTYAAAYEWDAPDGDAVKAITTTTPRYTALSDEVQGESIAYSPDGTAFLTVSDRTDGPVTIRRVTPGTGPAVSPSLSPSPTAGVATSSRYPIGGIPLWLTVGVATVGLVLAVVGILGVRRSRRAGAA
jgi:hypothetical protein